MRRRAPWACVRPGATDPESRADLRARVEAAYDDLLAEVHPHPSAWLHPDDDGPAAG